MGGPLLNKPSKVSPDARRCDIRLSRICDTHNAASGGLHHGQVQQLLRVTQPVPGYRWQLKIFPEVLPGSEDLGTRPQLHQPRRSQSPPKLLNVDAQGAKVNQNRPRIRFRRYSLKPSGESICEAELLNNSTLRRPDHPAAVSLYERIGKTRPTIECLTLSVLSFHSIYPSHQGNIPLHSRVQLR